MAINLIPYGQLPNGNYGINLDNVTGKPRAAVMEVQDTLPPVADPDNFAGRLVFDKTTLISYVFVDTPAPGVWDPLEGIPAEVGAVAGNPPTSPPPITGGLFWDTDTEVMFVWDGLEWMPIGGRFATIIVERKHVGDGATLVFPLGTSSAPGTATLVEVFINGIRQISNITDLTTPDYSVVGSNVVFVTPPAVDVEILTRAAETVAISQTAEITDVTHVVPSIHVPSGPYEVDTGRTDIQPEGMVVSVNGAIQRLKNPNQAAGDGDYHITQADTSIATLAKAFPTDVEALATTNSPHGITLPGTVVRIDGTDEPLYNDKFTVTGIDSPLIFRISVPATHPASASGDPIMFFTPSFISNKVVFEPDPFVGDEVIYIKSFKALVSAPVVGEANSLALIPGAVGQDISAAKVGDVLQVKGILAGTNVSVTDNGNDLVIASATGATYESRVGVTGNFVQPGPTTSYVGVSSTPSTPVTVDLLSVVANPWLGPGGTFAAQWRGRRIVIKDEGGNASVNPITIIGPTSTVPPANAFFEGGGTSYVINDDFGSVTLVFDDATWWITAKRP